jgi:hypothetical protein
MYPGRLRPIPQDLTPGSAAIRRISADGTQWRVLVETSQEADGYRGRLVFLPVARPPQFHPRQGAFTLRGRSRAQVIAAAHDLPERWLRAVVHSLV